MPKVEAESVRGFGRSDGHSSPRNTQAHKPPKKIDRSGWFKQWDQQIGPLVRLVDKIAKEVGENGETDHEVVQDYLNSASESMAKWMGVKW